MGFLKDVSVAVAADAAISVLDKAGEAVDKISKKTKQPRYEAACNAEMEYMLFAKRSSSKKTHSINVYDDNGNIEYIIKYENKMLHKPAQVVYNSKKHEISRVELVRNRYKHGYEIYLDRKEFGVISDRLNVQFNGWKMEFYDSKEFWYAYNRENRITLRIRRNIEGSNTDLIEFNNPRHAAISLLLYAMISYQAL